MPAFILLLSYVMKNAALLLLLLISLASCTLQKRHYRPGFYFSSGGSHQGADLETEVKKITLNKIPPAIRPAETTPASESRIDQKKIQPVVQKNNLVRTLHKNKSVKPEPRRGLAVVITDPRPNHVPQAGLRMFIFSLVFLAGAYYCFLHFPELVYVTVAILIVAFIFAMVSMITSGSARKEKIINSSGWRAVALITLLLDILEIAAIGLFFLALF